MLKKIYTTIILSIFLVPTLSLAAVGSQEAQITTQQEELIPDGFVTDFADVIEPNTESELERKLNTIEAKTGTEIAVITVKSLNNQNIDDFSYNLGEAWGIGEKGDQNGIVFLVAPTERQARIEVGLGLKPAIPDITAFGILKKHVIPFFQDNKYDAGIIAGVRELTQSIESPIYADKLAGLSIGELNPQITTIALIISLLITALISFINRSNNYWLGTITGFTFGLIATILSSALWFFLPALGLLGLILDFFLARKYLNQVYVGLDTSFGMNSFDNQNLNNQL